MKYILIVQLLVFINLHASAEEEYFDSLRAELSNLKNLEDEVIVHLPNNSNDEVIDEEITFKQAAPIRNKNETDQDLESLNLSEFETKKSHNEYIRER